jgi:hypothetical protein
MRKGGLAKGGSREVASRSGCSRGELLAELQLLVHGGRVRHVRGKEGGRVVMDLRKEHGGGCCSKVG